MSGLTANPYDLLCHESVGHFEELDRIRHQKASARADEERNLNETPHSARKWFWVYKEIIEHCAWQRGAGKHAPSNDAEHQAAIKRFIKSLHGAICRGEFGDERGRSRMRCLSTSPLAPEWLERGMVADFEVFYCPSSGGARGLVFDLLISRADAFALFSRFGITPPAAWNSENNAANKDGYPNQPEANRRKPKQEHIRAAVADLYGNSDPNVDA